MIYLAPFAGSTKILKYNLDGTFVTDYDLGERLNKPKLSLNPDGSISLVHLCFQGMSEMMGAVITPDSTITKYIPAPGQAINPRDKTVVSLALITRYGAIIMWKASNT